MFDLGFEMPLGDKGTTIGGTLGLDSLFGGGNSIGRRAKDTQRMMMLGQHMQTRWDYGHAWPREDSAIQRRVKDAHKAGVHPLWAMGGAPSGGGGSSPAYVGSVAGYGGGGRQSGVASFKKISAAESAFNEANLELLKSRNDLVQEQILASRQARTDPNLGLDGLTEVVPDQKISPDPHDKSETAAKDHPAWKSIKLGSGPGESIVIPAQDQDSIWDSVAIWIPILSVKKNRDAINKILDRKSYEAWMYHPIMIAGKYLKKQTMKGIMERLGKGPVKTSPVPQRLDKLIDWRRL